MPGNPDDRRSLASLESAEGFGGAINLGPCHVELRGVTGIEVVLTAEASGTPQLRVMSGGARVADLGLGLNPIGRQAVAGSRSIPRPFDADAGRTAALGNGHWRVERRVRRLR